MNRIPFSSFRSFSALFRDYTENPAELATFFNGDWRDPLALAKACQTAADAQQNREALVAAMRRQAADWGVEAASKHLLEQLARPDASAVVTGQQLGLFGGPLYTAFKALTTIQLAEHLTKTTGKPVVPVFWLEGEDHDFEEIASTGLMESDDAVKVTYADDASATDRTAVGRMKVGPGIEAAIADLERLLPPSDFREPLLDRIRTAYAPGTPMIKAFVSVMESILGPGRIAYISPDDRELKTLARELFRKEITDHGTSSAVLASSSAPLEPRWHIQVRTQPTNLFLHGDKRRTAIDATESGFRTRDGQALSESELLDMLDEDPGQFSPNVVLRPLMQDTLLPTAVYVAGPGEVAYFAQFKGLYAWAGLPMPIIYPRASATLLERRVGRILEKQHMQIPVFEEDIEKLFRRVVLDNMETDLEAAFKQASAGLHQAINDIKPAIEAVDRSLVGSAEAARAAFMKEWAQLQGKVIKAEKAQHEVLKGQLERASSRLFPMGTPQERFLSPVYFLNKYGPDFFAGLTERFDLDTSQHQVLDL